MATNTVDLRGQTIGDLTLVEPTGRRDGSGSVIWATRCKCGMEQLRSAAYLGSARAAGRHCACPLCRRDHGVARHTARTEGRLERLLRIIERIDPAALGSAVRTQAWLRSVLDWHGLYGLNYETDETRALRAECGAVLGEPSVERFEGILSMDNETESGDARGQLWSNLYPMRAPEDHGYLCAQCGATPERGWGCVECVVFVCYECGASESHHCGAGWSGGMTLDECGRRMGVTRERVRQIEGRAQHKARQVWNLMESDVAVKRHTARAAALARLTTPAMQELRREAEAEQKREAEAEQKRQAEASGRQASEAHQWSARLRQSEKVMELLRQELQRQVAVYAAGDASALPWAMRYSALPGVRFGNAAVVAENAYGVHSCARCRIVLVDDTPEARAHQSGDCTLVFAPPHHVVAHMRAQLGLPPPD